MLLPQKFILVDEDVSQVKEGEEWSVEVENGSLTGVLYVDEEDGEISLNSAHCQLREVGTLRADQLKLYLICLVTRASLLDGPLYTQQELFAIIDEITVRPKER